MLKTPPNTAPKAAGFEIREVGHVKSIKQFIAIVSDLESCINGQVVEFVGGQRGLVMGFSEDKVQVLVLDSARGIRSGDEIYNKGESFHLPVGEAFLRR